MPAEPPIPILLYHKIGRPPRGALVPGHYVSPGLFRRHLDYLVAHGYTAVRLLDLAHPKRPLPPRPVVITFDDGYRCLHEHAFPALVERGLAATIFLVARGLGDTNTWEQAAGDVAEPMLGLAEVREMQPRGLDFGSHTLTHARLTAVSRDQAAREIAESRSSLEEALAAPCPTFAYPYGDWNPEVRDLVQAAGYDVACTTARAAARRGDDLFALPRINIRRYNIIPRFGYKLWRAQRARS